VAGADLARASLPAETFVSGLTTTGQHGELFALRAELGTAWLDGAHSGRIDTTVSPASVSLARDLNDRAHPIHARYQARDGHWIDDAVVGYHDFYRATLHFAYDETFLLMAQRRNAQDRLDD
jgi:hypothetical protein